MSDSDIEYITLSTDTPRVSTLWTINRTQLEKILELMKSQGDTELSQLGTLIQLGLRAKDKRESA